MLGQDIVVLSSNEAIVDLIEKRSSIYSDRVSGTGYSDDSIPNTNFVAPDDHDAVVRPRRHSTKSRYLPLMLDDRTGTTSWSFAMMSYGTPWRVRRRLCHEALNVRLGKSFDGHQYKYVHRLLSCLLQEPENFIRELDL